MVGVAVRLVLAWALLLQAGAAPAQPQLRSTFPGRRIGGGTRGECTARVLAHLVPPSSVFAPGSSGLIALLEGPTANPRPLLVALRQANAAGSRDGARSRVLLLELPAAPAGVTLLVRPIKTASVWESSYRCEDDVADPADPLAMVSSAAPPAVSLLLLEVTPSDAALQPRLEDLRARCGQTVPREQLARAFDLSDVIAADWPARLPVRCPG